MKTFLTEEDRQLLDKFHFLRFDDVTYKVMPFIGALFGVAILFVPYTGWKVRPASPPHDIAEYMQRLLPYAVLWLLFMAPWAINRYIRAGERIAATKTVIKGRVRLKMKLLFKRKLIVFTPFHFVIYRRSYHFMELEEDDVVEMHISWAGRLFKYKRLTARDTSA